MEHYIPIELAHLSASDIAKVHAYADQRLEHERQNDTITASEWQGSYEQERRKREALEAGLVAAQQERDDYKADYFRILGERQDDLNRRVGAEAEAAAMRVDVDRLEWMLDEPEASRHLLNLLREKKGDKTSFKTMIDRLRKSKAAIDTARKESGNG